MIQRPLAEPDFSGPKEQIWMRWIPLSGQDYGLAFSGLESDLPDIDPLLDVFQIFI